MKLPAPRFERKIARPEELGSRIAELARPIVFTNGVFDILHRGHVTYLAQARTLGASLVVAVNSDASVRSLGKGDDRPLNTAIDRAALLAALECVTLVTIFDESVPLKPLELVRPDIYVKGGDYDMNAIPEAALVATLGRPVRSPSPSSTSGPRRRSSLAFAASASASALTPPRRLSARAFWGLASWVAAARRRLRRLAQAAAPAGCGTVRRADDRAGHAADREPARFRHYLGCRAALAGRFAAGRSMRERRCSRCLSALSDRSAWARSDRLVQPGPWRDVLGFDEALGPELGPELVAAAQSGSR